MATTYHPSVEEFERRASRGNVIAVHAELWADTMTPVAAAVHASVKPGGFVLESVVGGERRGRYSFVGCEPRWFVRGRGKDFFVKDSKDGEEALLSSQGAWAGFRDWLRQFRPVSDPQLPPFWGGAVGYVGYDTVRQFEPVLGARSDRPSDENDFEFGVGGNVIAFDNLRQTVQIIVPVVLQGQPVKQAYAQACQRINDCIEKLSEVKKPRQLHPESNPGSLQLPQSSFERRAFEQAVQRARQYIEAGDIFQTVLSQRFELPAANTDAFDVFRAMRVINPSPYLYYLKMQGLEIAGASPETLVRLRDGVAEVRPIAGTRPRGQDRAQDLAFEKDMLADPKEVAEHVMLVDLGRNDLGRIAKTGTVRLTEKMVVERYSHVMHIVSNVAAEVDRDVHACDVLQATFPAGTLSGAPKVRAMQIIDELEPVSRGIYGGAVGYIGFDGAMDVAIAIRTVVKHEGVFRIQAGAGIVEASDPAKEYEETINKARSSLLALKIAMS